MIKSQQDALEYKRNQKLDLIKLLSCVAVVMLHCVKAEEPSVGMVLYQLSVFAVPCFFMASGYLLMNKSAVSWSYSFRKIGGITRLVVAWNIIYYGFEYASMAIFSGTVDFQGFLRSCVLGPVKCILQKGDLWQFWYLGALTLLYLALPLLHHYLGKGRKTGNSTKRTAYSWCVLATISVLIQLAGMLFGQPLQQYVCQTFRLWTSVQYFLVGALMPAFVERLQERLSVKKHLILTGVATVASLLWRLALDYGWLHWGLGEYYYDDPVTILWIGLVFSLLMRIKLSAVSETWISRLAPLIMGVYIIHVPIRNVIRVYFTATGDLERILLAILVSIFSFILTYLVKRLPFGKYLLEI